MTGNIHGPCPVFIRPFYKKKEVFILNHSIGFLLLLQVILIALNAVFACAEIAVISMNDSKLAKLAAEGDKRAIRLARLTNQPARFLATIQVAITLSGFLGSAFAADNFSDPLVDWVIDLGVPIAPASLDTIAVIFITLILSYFTLIFGELVPKRVAMRKAERLALGMSSLVSTISLIFAPIVWLLTVSTNAILRLIGIDPNEDDEQISEEEIRMMVDAGSRKGTIDPEEKKLIQNVFEFDDLDAGEIAVHRTDVDMLWMSDNLEQWNTAIRNGNHTYYPICDGSVDRIIGILNSKQYLRLESPTRETVMTQAVRPAYFIPENVKADILFKNMKQTHHHFAVVLDEYGGMVGIITMNDLIEQIVGDFGPEEIGAISIQEIQEMTLDGETIWTIRGSTPLREVAEALEVTFPKGECDTFGGYVFGILGAVPEDGCQLELKTEQLMIRLEQIEDHQLIRSTVRKIPKPTEEQD